MVALTFSKLAFTRLEMIGDGSLSHTPLSLPNAWCLVREGLVSQLFHSKPFEDETGPNIPLWEKWNYAGEKAGG